MSYYEKYINKLPLKFAELQILVSTLIIVISLFAIIFRYEELQTICVCTSNYLAWAWITFSINIFTGLITIILSIFIANKNFTRYFIVLQSLLFFFGIALLVMYGARLMNVI